jgi:hypothetical protein
MENGEWRIGAISVEGERFHNSTFSILHFTFCDSNRPRRKRNCRTDERKACEDVHHKRDT